MTDNDLIRRGDAKARFGERGLAFVRSGLDAIPAVQPTVSPKQLAAQPDDVAALERILRERGAVFDAMVDAAEDAAGKDVSFNVVVGRALRAAIAEIKGESHD